MHCLQCDTTPEHTRGDSRWLDEQETKLAGGIFFSKSLRGGGHVTLTVFPVSSCKFTSVLGAEHDGKLLI